MPIEALLTVVSVVALVAVAVAAIASLVGLLIGRQLRRRASAEQADNDEPPASER